MHLTLILGPMKSGKSFELISHFAPLKYTNIPFALYQSARNVREEAIWSRSGITISAKKVHSLAEALESNIKVLGLDEAHMFDPGNAEIVEKLLKMGVKVIASGLDTDYQGRMFEIIKRLMELGPAEIKYKRAVCERCRMPDAVYTQVFKMGEPLLAGAPAVIPEDGTYTYRPVCRRCFVRQK